MPFAHTKLCLPRQIFCIFHNHRYQQLSTIRSIVKSGVAAGFLFRELAQEDGALAALPTETPLEISVSLAWKKESYSTEAMRCFQSFIKDEFRQ